jgi:hypothetical protein
LLHPFWPLTVRLTFARCQKSFFLFAQFGSIPVFNWVHSGGNYGGFTLSAVTSKCTTHGHFKVHHPAGFS